MQDIRLILHDIRSTYNVGAILRTAECAGVRTVYLTGYTPDPIDRFGRKRKDVAKSAVGAEDMVAWQHVDDTVSCIASLQAEGVQVVALEQHPRSVGYASFKHSGPLALVLGEEVQGIPEEIVALCDAVIEIPVYGNKESLNVSVATGIALYRLIE
jgi:23S rRNA (guanosine2251-2'-O)-methyltransferase